MHTYRNTFPYQNTFLAVIHVEEEAQTLRNIAVAQDNGADGVFLINHSIAHEDLIAIYERAKQAFPSFWMGLNLLGLGVLDAANWAPNDYVGFWVDDAGVRGGKSDHFLKAKRSWVRRSRNPSWKGLCFGGVAFKYQEPVADPAAAAQRAIALVDVITTSGEGTGLAPDPEKIRVMKQAIGVYPLAIASGITPENVHLYTQWADCFLVATGISDSHTELNPGRVRDLAKLMRFSRC